ncbi:MAG TPA: Ig domain-containing protein [Pirellulales bacterium]|jgi:hypothetical protein|nr:Ig domain-containing protein [Pirellulales bacterium]
MRHALAVVVGILGGIDLADAAPPAMVEDIFGRNLENHGLVLVDWDGYIANPAIKVFLSPPPGAALPATAVLSSNEPRLHFDLPSLARANGPRKELSFASREKQPVYVAIFPDRDGHDDDLALAIAFTDADGRKTALSLPVHVVDQDRDRESEFSITVDFSRDTTGFFADERHLAEVLQAADDWAYFLDGDGLAEVPAGAETTFIWDPDGFKSGRDVTNTSAYRGYLLYAYGIRGNELRSGGEPSWHGQFQKRGDDVLPVRRSGGLEIEVQGNYNQRGWMVGLSDADWWKAVNLRETVADLYSIAHHEIGHALFFNFANLRVKRGRQLDDPLLRAYLGSNPTIDKTDHFDGIVDPASRRGAFGNEYHGRLPWGRWLITKHDLLAAQAIGYKLRTTSAFAPLSIAEGRLPAGKLAAAYTVRLRAEGGIPLYDWSIADGALPEGIVLDSFSGEIRGTPRQGGQFEFTVRLRDYDEGGKGVSRAMTLEVSE